MKQLILNHYCSLVAAVLIGTVAFGAGPAMAQGSWISEQDYPIKALREGRQGTVGFRLVISDHGLIESCEVTESSGHYDLDRATCDALKRRAKFKPATDAAGKPVKASFSSKFRWLIPD